MFERCAAIYRSSTAVAGITVTSIAVVSLSATPVAAWHRHHHTSRHYRPTSNHYSRHHARPGAAVSNIASIVVDGNSGRVLYARGENEVRHPASITKVMTLYLLFEQLDKGRFRLDSRIPISAHAAAQAPTKLGLDPGNTISIDDAIKAVVTKSANDIAVAIAEAVGGDEDTFCMMMTRKAHALGMTSTRYVNASGLPDDEQVTTARDLSILGRAIQERFPRYYHYFSTRVFYYGGIPNPNHNHLLGRIDGMDGIKTGYTRSSGFNLLTSVKRDGHYIVSVVLGGATAGSRDKIMADLIEGEIDKSSTVHSASLIAENDTQSQNAPAPAHPLETADFREMPMPPHKPMAEAKPKPLPPEQLSEMQPMPEPKPAAKPLAPAGEPTPSDPVQIASISDQVPVARPRPAFVAATPKPAPMETDAATVKPIVLDGSTARQTTPSTTPSSMRWVVGPAPVKEPKEKEKADTVKLAKAETPRTDSPASAEPVRPAIAKTGWMIQIGATDDAAKAGELLARAKAEGHGALGAAQPFTEKVQKGSETLYRARFAGLPEDKAEAACKALKRSGFACFATKN
jgi:D-alanyl-D-alanine carboxypeptidase